MSEAKKYQDILFSTYSVAAGRELARQQKEVGFTVKEEATAVGLHAVASQVVRDIAQVLDERLAGDLPTIIWDGKDLIEALDTWLNERDLMTDPEDYGS